MRFLEGKGRCESLFCDTIPVTVLETLSRREEEHCPDTLRVSGICLKSVPVRKLLGILAIRWRTGN